MSKNSTLSKNAWNEKNYDRVSILLKKGDREKLKVIADREGVSVSRFVIESVNDRVPGLLAILDDESKKKKAKDD